MKRFSLPLSICMILSLPIVVFAQKADPDSRATTQVNPDEPSRATGLKKLTTRSFDHDIEIDIDLDVDELETSIGTALESVEIVLKNLELHFEGLELDLSHLNAESDRVMADIPDLTIDVEPIEVDLEGLDVVIDEDQFHWDNSDKADGKRKEKSEGLKKMD